jgi:hypothetical protein
MFPGTGLWVYFKDVEGYGCKLRAVKIFFYEERYSTFVNRHLNNNKNYEEKVNYLIA